MKWMVFEDSLECIKGHFFEYMDSFARDLPGLGDQMTLLVSRRAESDICSHFSAESVLPESIGLKLSDGAPTWKRYLRIPIHAGKTFFAIRKYLKGKSAPDIIFIPTLSVHHLLGWTFLIKLGFIPKTSRILLISPGFPLRKKGEWSTLDGSPTSRLMFILLQALGPQITSGKVILGAETQEMKTAAANAFGVPFTYFPHPVSSPLSSTSTDSHHPPLIMACYGQARHEKGSDLLVRAIETYLKRNPETSTRFVFQWIEDFCDADGRIIRLSESLKKNPRVEIVNRFFEVGEYAKRLAWTQVLLLPYRSSSYGLRVSRVAIEAMVNGIPVVASLGTTLAEQTGQFGAAVLSEEDDEESLVAAIETAEQHYESLSVRARQMQVPARRHFSVEHFRNILLSIRE